MGSRARRCQWASTLFLPTKHSWLLPWKNRATSCSLSRYGKTTSIPSQLPALSQQSQSPSPGYRQEAGAGNAEAGWKGGETQVGPRTPPSGYLRWENSSTSETHSGSRETGHVSRGRPAAAKSASTLKTSCRPAGAGGSQAAARQRS